MLVTGELPHQSLGRRLVGAALRVKTERTHLVLDFAEDLVGGGRAFHIQVPHVAELLR